MALPATQSLSQPPAAIADYPRLAYASGGRGPVGRRGSADNAVVGTAIFLTTEVMVFAALISAFLILRAGSSAWPPIGQPRLPIGITGLNTVVLLLSAYTMRRAVRADAAGAAADTRRWLRITAALGTAFVTVQGSEWIQLIGYGLHASSSIYGATFYTLIGCHGLHVVAAVLVVIGTAWRAPDAGDVRRRARLEACQLYWFFVVGIWPVLYVLVYLS